MPVSALAASLGVHWCTNSWRPPGTGAWRVSTRERRAGTERVIWKGTEVWEMEVRLAFETSPNRNCPSIKRPSAAGWTSYTPSWSFSPRKAEGSDISIVWRRFDSSGSSATYSVRFSSRVKFPPGTRSKRSSRPTPL